MTKNKNLSSSTSTELLIIPQITEETLSPTLETLTEDQTTEGPTEGIETPSEPETTSEPILEEIKTLTSISPKGEKFTFRDPSQLGIMTYTTPTSQRMGELMILKLQDGYRTSGDHPNLKKTPKWMINPKFNGKERWMDLTKIHSFNMEHGLIILSRSEINHRGMENFIEGPFIQIETTNE